MQGSHAFGDFAVKHPEVVLILFLALLVPAAGPRAHAVWTRWARQRKAQSDLRRKRDAARKRMLEGRQSEEFYAYLSAYLELVGPQHTGPVVQEVKSIILTTSLVECAFESEGLEWALAHFSPTDYAIMSRGAETLGLHDMVGPIRMLANSVTAYERAPGDMADPGWKPFEQHLETIRRKFVARGGIQRFRDTANTWLWQQMKTLPIR